MAGVLIGVPVDSVDSRKQVIQYPVVESEMDAFDHSHVVQRDMNTILLHFEKFPTGVASQAERFDLVPIGPVDGIQDVGTVSGTADGHQQVTGLRQIHELLDKDLVVINIVGHGHDPTDIIRQTLHSQAFETLILQQRIRYCPFGEIFR